MMAPDDVVKAVAAALLLAHLAVLVSVLLFRARMGWVVGLNLIVGAGVALYWMPRLSDLLGHVDLVLAFVGFELAILAASILAGVGVRVPPVVHWIAFAVNAFLSAAALAFIVTFRITRLI